MERGSEAASGLKWKEVGAAKTAYGDKLTNEKLSEALEGQTEFTKEEWEAFDIKDVRMEHFIKAGEKYFKPAEVASLYDLFLGKVDDINVLPRDEYVKAYKEFPLHLRALEKEIRSNRRYGLRNSAYNIPMSADVAKKRLDEVIREYEADVDFHDEGNYYADYDGLLRLSLNKETVCQVMMVLRDDPWVRDDGIKTTYLEIRGIIASPLKEHAVYAGDVILRLLKGILLPAEVRLLVNPIPGNGTWIHRLLAENDPTVWIYTEEKDYINLRREIVPLTSRNVVMYQIFTDP